MDSDTARAKLLDAAEELFYARGIQTVGMDDIRTASGVSLKRLYQLFPAKEQLVEAYLERRDTRWRARLSEYVEQFDDPERRVLAVFDWLELWFAEPGFRGCAWINSHGELGAVSEGVTRQARHHKEAFRRLLDELVAAAGLPAELSAQLLLLAEGAMVTAGIFGRTDPARQGRMAAAALLAVARRG
ncbi:AcrR family transcriptional regulator [Amycolatopsis bartoniae]|uniref:TetR family transcriptional regulator n=1 Tax=Amycolatopsis bartoniae TaxID=941986 RepID=A0A8H9MEJ1_9PSEU|nr:TetR/AcrR family transcriptional regulator [Amycolatopsis bartoniae]MBB2934179.1 AcrR family transcriptional regulator [Amycolatopsis bartoniae]TVT08708.1 TetR/AcrR family transcriptional regulator [Amycolatopsis bartoniae]GHF88662.1 TetR family transcriptional regulator [Amycolatopsis bartoniae]